MYQTGHKNETKEEGIARLQSYFSNSTSNPLKGNSMIIPLLQDKELFKHVVIPSDRNNIPLKDLILIIMSQANGKSVSIKDLSVILLRDMDTLKCHLHSYKFLTIDRNLCSVHSPEILEEELKKAMTSGLNYEPYHYNPSNRSITETNSSEDYLVYTYGENFLANFKKRKGEFNCNDIANFSKVLEQLDVNAKCANDYLEPRTLQIIQKTYLQMFNKQLTQTKIKALLAIIEMCVPNARPVEEINDIFSADASRIRGLLNKPGKLTPNEYTILDVIKYVYNNPQCTKQSIVTNVHKGISSSYASTILTAGKKLGIISYITKSNGVRIYTYNVTKPAKEHIKSVKMTMAVASPSYKKPTFTEKIAKIKENIKNIIEIIKG